MDSKKTTQNNTNDDTTKTQSVNFLNGEINKGFKFNEQASSRSDVSSDFVIVSDASTDLNKQKTEIIKPEKIFKDTSNDLIPLVPMKSKPK